MEVWIVKEQSIGDEEWFIDCVFDSEDKAKEYVNECNKKWETTWYKYESHDVK